MLIKNLEQGILVNGSTGKVLGFSSYAEATRDHTAIANAVTDGERKEVPEHVRKSACKWPLVRFTNGRELLCIPQEFTVNNGEGETEAARLQVPLILAWALSVHKSQGQTLERVKVDLSRTFEKGQGQQSFRILHQKLSDVYPPQHMLHSPVPQPWIG
ncbi:hypothetical protein FA95DRAFT_1204693 [Auriscalpium vulgare]|uniref:Uncharacterized protein n=1 Tax=Auriscalpium vulgare TaxID=40419 RepID=A0ACB8RVU5_9AGAM|nr:hypothetical protein FA95DRAFT_1204693 [Auriscalpium vulgare]